MFNCDDFSDIAWQLFVSTGNINYYNLHKRTQALKEKEEKNKRN